MKNIFLFHINKQLNILTNKQLNILINQKFRTMIKKVKS